MRPTDLVARLRQDFILVCGLLLALVTAFHPGLQAFLHKVRDLEREASIALVPSLLVLSAAFLLHQARKRRQDATRAAIHASEAASMRARTAELEAVLAFERDIAEALDLLALRQAVERHLPALGALRQAWLWVRLGGESELLRLKSTCGPASGIDLAQAEALAALALRHDAGAGSSLVDGQACFPLRAGGEAVGVLGVSLDPGPLAEAERRLLALAATTIAIGVKNVHLVGQIRAHGLRDALTGCFNRAHGLETLRVELRRAQRMGSPLSLLMIDLDHFKDVNDTHGHLAGDALLAEVGGLLRATLRGSDAKVRYGGEEFLVVLPDTPSEAALQVAEMLRARVASLVVTRGTTSFRVTASVGLTTTEAGEVEVETVVARADEALYEAKRAGRDRVRHAAGLPRDVPPPESWRRAGARATTDAAHASDLASPRAAD